MVYFYFKHLQHFFFQHVAKQNINCQLFLFCLHYITTFTAVSRKILVFLYFPTGLHPWLHAVAPLGL